jgi:hypothetical protein
MKTVEEMKKPSVVRQIALNANEQELEALERIKQHYSRTSDADTIRFLIIQENKKILTETVHI